MAKGQAAVDWKKPENNAKLFAAVLALIPGTLDYKKIAAVFGPNVPANAISYRLGVVRKEGAALGLKPGSGSGSGSTPVKTKVLAVRTKPTAITAITAKKNVVKGEGRKRGPPSDDESDDADVAVDNDSEEEESSADSDSEEESDAETDDYEETPTTPARSAKRQKTTKAPVKKRAPPRKTKKTRSKKPKRLPVDADGNFMDDDGNLVDEDGNLVENGSSGTEEEESDAPSDGSWVRPDYSNIAFYKIEDNVFDPTLEWHLPEGFVEERHPEA